MVAADYSTQTQAKKYGDQIAINIPQNMADKVNIKDNTAISIKVVNGTLVVEAEKNSLSLEEMVSKVTDENRHDMIDWGKNVGREKL